MRALDTLDSFFFKDSIQQASCAAIAVKNHNAFELLSAFKDFLPYLFRDQLRAIMQIGGQTLDVQMIPAVRVLQSRNLAGQRTASD